MIIWFDILIKAVIYTTLVIEFYLLWLILCKTPANMASFRFSLLILLLNEIVFTLHVGVAVEPEMVVPVFQGALVNGPLRLVGPNCGRIALALAIFFGAGVFSNQIYCLLFRYTAIQQRFDNLSLLFNSWPIRLLSMAIGYTNMSICAYFSFYIIASPQEITSIVANKTASMSSFSPEFEEYAQKSSMLLLLTTNRHAQKWFAIVVMGGFVLSSLLSIGFSVRIYRIIQANAGHFTRHTFKLHRQLTMLLIIQFCLPIIFLGVPVIWMTVAVALDIAVSKTSGDAALLLGCLYSLANTAVTLVFVAPYRKFTLKVLQKAWELCRCRSHGIPKENPRRSDAMQTTMVMVTTTSRAAAALMNVRSSV